MLTKSLIIVQQAWLTTGSIFKADDFSNSQLKQYLLELKMIQKLAIGLKKCEEKEMLIDVSLKT